MTTPKAPPTEKVSASGDGASVPSNTASATEAVLVPVPVTVGSFRYVSVVWGYVLRTWRPSTPVMRSCTWYCSCTTETTWPLASYVRVTVGRPRSAGQGRSTLGAAHET